MGNTSVVAINSAPIIVANDVEVRDAPSDSKFNQSKGGGKILLNVEADVAVKGVANQISDKVITLPDSSINEEDERTEGVAQKFKFSNPDNFQDWIAASVQLEHIASYNVLLSNKHGGSRMSPKPLIENEKSKEYNGKALRVESSISHETNAITGVTVSPDMLIGNQIMRRSASSASMSEKVAVSLNVEAGIFVSVEASVKDAVSVEIGENYAFIATRDRLRDVQSVNIRRPNVRDPESLKINEIVSEDFFFKGGNSFSAKLKAENFFFNIASGVEFSTSTIPYLKRVSVRAALAPNGDRHEVITFSSVKANGSDSKIFIEAGLNEIEVGGVKGAQKAQKGVTGEISGTKSVGEGTRSGFFIEIDRKSKEGQDLFDKIISRAEFSEDDLNKASVILAGRFHSGSTKIGTVVGTKFEGFKIKHKMDTTINYEVNQETGFELFKSSDNSVMSKSVGIYGSTIAGGFQATGLSKSAEYGLVNKFKNNGAKLVSSESFDGRGNPINKNTSFTGIDISSKNIIAAIENDNRLIEKGESPVFQGFKMTSVSGEVLSNKDILAELEKIQQRGEELYISASTVKGSNFDKAYSQVGEDVKAFAKSRVTYIKVVDNHTTNTINDNLEEIYPSELNGIKVGLDSEDIGIELFKMHVDNGELLINLAKYHEESKCKDTYPIIFEIITPH